jgi:O-phosphoseryl-tRNA(Cys) synthetase
MPFMSLSDRSDLARAYAVLDATWDELKSGIPEAQKGMARERLAYLIAGLAPLAIDEKDLIKNVLRRYKKRVLLKRAT